MLNCRALRPCVQHAQGTHSGSLFQEKQAENSRRKAEKGWQSLQWTSSSQSKTHAFSPIFEKLSATVSLSMSISGALFIYLLKACRPVNSTGSQQGFSLNQILQKLYTIQNMHTLQTSNIIINIIRKLDPSVLLS